MSAKIVIFIDADACPVKQEVYKVAERYRIETYVVANRFMRLPQEEFIKPVFVAAGLDVADDWIASHTQKASIVITNDVPLADRVVKAGGVALSSTGRMFDEASIGRALATRNLMEDLRAAGTVTGGPKPFSKRDRSDFLRALDLAVQRLKRQGHSV